MLGGCTQDIILRLRNRFRHHKKVVIIKHRRHHEHDHNQIKLASETSPF